MKSLVLLWLEAAKELGRWCDTSIARDYVTVTRRVETEGLSFLTITLPAFCKAFEACLEAGCVAPGAFVGFKTQRASSPLPRFLGGFVAQVFDTKTGLIHPDVNPDCVFAVRQLTSMFGKMLLPCSPPRIEAAFDNYVKTEMEVQNADLDPSDYHRLARIAAILFGDVLSSVSKEIADECLLPKHGPGNTADYLAQNERYCLTAWPERLEGVFRYNDYALPSSSYFEETDRVNFLLPGQELPVRVVQVPKTLKTPRIIALEPAHMQYMQQAILDVLRPRLELQRIPGNTRDSACYPMINFTSQESNRLLAREGSLSGSLATLDLSEASDRVSLQHVSAVFASSPNVLEAVLAVRSTHADVPGHGVIPLTKYASMGSALCFPVEAMVFLAVVFHGLCTAESTQGLRSQIVGYKDQVRVYGDDIIVPTHMVNSVIQSLELFGFKVNTGKSFWNGKFRESCGGDYFEGHDVNVVKVRREFPSSHTDALEVKSLAELRNRLYWRGMWKTAYWLDDVIAPLLKGYFPYVSSTSELIGRESALGCESPVLYRLTTQVPLEKGWCLSSKPPVDILDGWPALLKFFLKRGEDPLPENHLAAQGRPQIVRTKLRWLPPS